MNKNLFIISSILLTSCLFSTGVVFGQETAIGETATAPEVPAEIQQVIEQTAEQAIKQEQISAEVKIDTAVSPEDLGVTKVGILPDSPLYIFKRMGRGLKQAFTFNPVKKAELQLQIANEKMVEAAQLIEEKGTEKAINIASNIINEANRDYASISQRSEQLKQESKKDAPRVEEFLDKVADQSLKQQVLLQKLEEQVPEQAFAKIEGARQTHLENFAEVMTKVADKPEDIADRLPRVIEAQEGSDFKELKAIEILKNLEEKAPAEAKAALNSAQETVTQKLEQRIVNMPQEVRQEKLSQYMESLPGNPIRQFEALDVMKQNLKSPEMILETEILKDKTVKKIEEQFGQLKNEQVREQFMAPLKNDNLQDLRTMTEIEMRMGQPQEEEKPGLQPTIYQGLQKIQQEAQQNFQERLVKEPELIKKDETIQRMMTKPDVIDLKMSQDLNQVFAEPQAQESISPPTTQILILKDFQNQVTNKFVENIEKTPASVEAVPSTSSGAGKFVSPIPQGLEVLQKVKEKAPLEAQKGLERAIEAQTQAIQEHIIRVDDPAVFEKYKQQIEQNSNIKAEIERSGSPTLLNKIEQKEQKIEEAQKQEQEIKWQKMQEINKEMFNPLPSTAAPTTPTPQKSGIMPQITPEMQTKIEEFKKTMPQTTTQPPKLRSIAPQEPTNIQQSQPQPFGGTQAPKPAGSETQGGLQIKTEQKMQPMPSTSQPQQLKPEISPAPTNR